jgi:hypothetical protein
LARPAAHTEAGYSAATGGTSCNTAPAATSCPGSTETGAPRKTKMKLPPPPKGPPIHLHWLYHRGPAAVRGLRKGSSLCGCDGLVPALLTVHRADATCPACEEAAAKDTRTGSQCAKK